MGGNLQGPGDKWQRRMHVRKDQIVEKYRRFPDDNTKGAVAYGLMRTLQMRRLRLPKPQVGRGTKP